MRSINVRQLKNNPSGALRDAVEGPVLVLKGDHPEALLIHLDVDSMPDAAGVRLALAVSVFKDGAVSLGRAARMAQVSVSDLVSHLSRLGVPIVPGEGDEAGADLETLDEWLGSF
jgi:predicted HTH domain antitoxin